MAVWSQKAIALNTGARGLRSILESIMLDVMYELPDMPNVQKVVVTKATIEGTEKPQILFKDIA